MTQATAEWQPPLSEFQRTILRGLDSRKARTLEDLWCKVLNGSYAPHLAVSACQEAGIEYPVWLDFHDAGEPVDTPAIERHEQASPQDPGAFPEHLLEVPGFVGDFARYCLDYARRPQPVLALGASISLMSLLIGRKVCTEDGTRPNLYGLAVAPSSAGKEAGRSCIKDVLFAAGGSDLIGEGIASTAALVHGMSRHNSRIWLIDEVGQWLCGLAQGGDRTPSYLVGILPELMKFYTASHTFYKGAEYKSDLENVQIVQPYAVLFGSSTPEKLYRGLTADSISDGFMSRVLIWEAPAEYPSLVKPAAKRPPGYLVDRAREWLGYIPGGGNMSAFVPQPDEIHYEADAAEYLDAFERRCDDLLRSESAQFSSLWGRAAEKGRKLALIAASSIAQPGRLYSVGMAHAVWASQLTEYLTRRLIYLASTWISDGKFDANAKKILRAIKEAGQLGITGSELCRITRSMRPSDREEAIKSLLDSREVEKQTENKRGRPGSIFYLSEYIK